MSRAPARRPGLLRMRGVLAATLLSLATLVLAVSRPALAGGAAGTAPAGAAPHVQPQKPPAPTKGRAAALPRGFVRLTDVAPEIIEDIRYATAQNFTGRSVPGYQAGRCILAAPVAAALARIAKAAAVAGYALKVYDCYRPIRAVDAFVDWAETRTGNAAPYYHPRIARRAIMPLGYIARHSSHSRGTAVDLTLVRSPGAQSVGDPVGDAGNAASKPLPRAVQERATCISPRPDPGDAAGLKIGTGTGTGQNTGQNTGQSTGQNTGQNTGKRSATSIDMGTAWDCFDTLSHTLNSAIPAHAKANRRRLLALMEAEGFRNYHREWWHFSRHAAGFERARNFAVD